MAITAITVKLTQIPGPVSEYGLESGQTVQDLLNIAGISSLEGKALQVNSANADGSTTLNDGDRVTIAKGAKGNV